LAPNPLFTPELRADELAADVDAAHWACFCEWLPGTGHCCRRDCPAECLFRPQREAEARQVIARRRRRRAGQLSFKGRGGSR